MKLIHLVPNHAAADWKRAPREWNEARAQFALIFGERLVGH
jgi:putative transposase